MVPDLSAFNEFGLAMKSSLVLLGRRGKGNQHSVCNAIYEFTNKANDWNRDVFGNIFWKKKNLIARMLGAEKALARTPPKD